VAAVHIEGSTRWWSAGDGPATMGRCGSELELGCGAGRAGSGKAWVMNGTGGGWGAHGAFYRAGRGEERAGGEGERRPASVEFKCDGFNIFST
jgi:hypothetical protein